MSDILKLFIFLLAIISYFGLGVLTACIMAICDWDFDDEAEAAMAVIVWPFAIFMLMIGLLLKFCEKLGSIAMIIQKVKKEENK